MLTYELAKELWDAGFPPRSHPSDDYGDVLQYPTLTELIEACGEQFASLEKGLTTKEQLWLATGGKYHGEDDGPYRYEFELFGSTPEEAVARLWLALNKPDA